jgi:hypothetical protein
MRRQRDYDDQEEFDRIPSCRWCGAGCPDNLDHCPVCERKIRQGCRTYARGERDLVAAFRRSFGTRLSDWLNDDVQEDADTAEDLREATFERE